MKNFILILAVLFVAVGCEDWTQTEPARQKPSRPSQQDPVLWAKYVAAINTYKAGDHTMVFASFDNGTVNATSEKDFLRSLPDSLDIVSLTNADNFSKYDAEDLAALHDLGTRVVYFVDYAQRSAEFADNAALGAYLDKVVAKVGELGLDGFSFSGYPNYGSAEAIAAQKAVAALFIEKFAADPAKLLLFEGDPQFIAQADREKIDWFVLDTKDTNNATDLKMQVVRALGASGIPREKLLLGAQTEFEFIDEQKVGSNAIEALTLRVPELGPLAGLCIYNVNQDYLGGDVVFSRTRASIQTLNPSK